MATPSIRTYRRGRKLSQRALARSLGVSQAYVSQLESGVRPVSRKLAERLAGLPDLPPSVLPPEHTQLDDPDVAEDLAALDYPPFAKSMSMFPPSEGEADADNPPGDPPAAASGSRGGRPQPLRPRRRKNPAAVILAILARRHVAPSITAAVPWLLLSHDGLNAGWLVDQARRRNLQNRLGFLTTLAIELARARASARAAPPDEEAHAQLAKLEALQADLETSRLANEDTLARVLTPAERQFFEEHRSAAARHWHLLTGLTAAQLPYR